MPPFVRRFIRKQDDIGDQIYHVLRKKGMTQRAFAEAAGMTDAQVSRILAGNANITIKTLVRLEEALGEEILASPALYKEEPAQQEGRPTA